VIQHIVLFHWKDGVSSAQLDAVDQAVKKLRSQIPELKDLKWGPDLDFREGNADWGLAAIFEDHAGWQAYQVHPAHKALVSDVISPITASRTAIQFQIGNASQ
jgi:Stress responsive A/B Barrel Domain